MSLSAGEIADNIQSVRMRMQQAAESAGRNAEDIHLVAVSKKVPVAGVTAAIAAGQHSFGENILQDAATRQSVIGTTGVDWHFIGHLQTNKADTVARQFDWLHTLDSIKLARKLSAARPAPGNAIKVLIQINIASDPDKFGLPPGTLPGLIDALLEADLPGIELRGLMTIGQRDSTTDQRRAEFAALRELGAECGRRYGEAYFGELSMGMSDDFETAIAEGATIVRIGSAIFGPRITGR